MRMKGKKPIFNYRDCWSLDEVFDKVICEGVKAFKKYHQESGYGGVPVALICDMGLNPDSDSDHDKALDEWYNILDKIIYAFGGNEPNPSDYDYHFDWIKCESGGVSLSDPINPEEYERYELDCEKHRAKVKEGRELFIKYYDCLWI